jgi:DNA-binding NarL/FixJ family response regulator
MTLMNILNIQAIQDLFGERLPPPPRRLSPREQQVVDLATGGRSQKEIAFELGLADATVRVLHARAMKKLGRSGQARARAAR